MDYLARANELSDRLSSIREALHRHPELGNQERWTSKFLIKQLRKLGLEVKTVLDTGIVATLHGTAPDKTDKKVGLRADMDALPVSEPNECKFRSTNDGIMHACGHDIHMTSALGAAMLLSETKDSLKGDVVFLFEPDEEGAGGAQRMIDAGAIEGVSAVFGGHVSPDLPVGTIGIKYGKFYAASDVITVTVHGKSCHGATPEKGRDALLAAADMVRNLSELKAPSNDKCVLSFGSLNAGTACNIIADTAVFSGILRTLGPENRNAMKKGIKDVVKNSCARYGVTADVEIRDSYGGVVNSDEETKLFEDTAKSLFGNSKVKLLRKPTMTTEDFGYFIDACSGSFCSIGAGCSEPLHSPNFLPDGKAAVYASALYAQTLVNYLETHCL